MPKIQGRKPPRRKRAVTQDIDEDLATLARVLDESKLDNNAKGWFIPPWHDGWNAIELALAQAHHEEHGQYPGYHPAAVSSGELWEVQLLVDKRIRTNEAYHNIGEILVSGTLIKRRAFYAALRCYQVLIANSHGGGHVYNDVLRPIFNSIEITERLASLVEQHRRNDAIGKNADEKYKRAFQIAWRRGLYLAAYSLTPPIN